MLTEPMPQEALRGPSSDVSVARTVAARLAVAVGIFIALFLAYNVVARILGPGRAHSLRTPLDDSIPFVPQTVYLYSAVYTAMLLPLFTIRCPDLFRRAVLAYLVVIAVSLVCFAAYPVTAIGFRPADATIDTTSFYGWGVRLTYAVDPPYNLFPSLHLSIAVTAAIAAWKARPAFGVMAGAIATGIGVSITTMKQHFVADGVGALLVSVTVWALLLRPYVRDPDGRSAWSWRGPLSYLAFHASVYAALYAAYRAGATAW